MVAASRRRLKKDLELPMKEDLGVFIGELVGDAGPTATAPG